MALTEKLTLWQNDLIDMSRMNKLLYFSVAGRSPAIPLAPDAEQLFVRATRPKSSFPLSFSDVLPHADIDDDERERRLKRLMARAREALDDRGTQVLYLTFGLLHWRDTETSQEQLQSPLVLVPVKLTRNGLLGQFQLASVPNEEVAINPTLHEKLTHDFDITLPDYEDIRASINTGEPPISAITLAHIYAEIQNALPSQTTWTVSTEVYLGIFSFHKLVMYQDLKRHADNVFSHNVLRSIAGENNRLPQPPGQYLARDLDARVRPHDTLEILDADSSQQEAIIAAKAGASFVLQGPPGTGKSQTIANIIAESLALNRRVLFVSEKLAALSVVRQRLDSAGLGDFCLELHSQKTDKKAFIADLARAMSQPDTLARLSRSDNAWQRDSDALLDQRQRLNSYVRELHQQCSPLGTSVFTAYGELARLADVPDMSCAIPDVAQLTYRQFENMREALRNLHTWNDVLERFDSYPWRETLVDTYSLEIGANIRHHFGALADTQPRLQNLFQSLAAILGEPDAPPSFAWATGAMRRAQHARRSPAPPAHWLQIDAPARLHPLALDLAVRSKRYKEMRTDFDTRYQPTAHALDHFALLRTLTDDVNWAINCLRPVAGQDLHEVALTWGADIGEHLWHINTTLAQVRNAAQSVATLLEIPPPTTLAETARLVEMAALVLTSPHPPRAWLDVDTFTEQRAVALDARERYLACRQSRDTLTTAYTPDFFALDLAAIAQHATLSYQSLLRYLRPTYYQDVKRLRTTLRTDQPQPRTSLQMLADAAQGARLSEDERWLRDHVIDHARVLGQLFDSGNTDWNHVRAALDWTASLHRLFDASASPKVLSLIVGPSQTLAPLQAAYTQLADLWDAWQAKAAWLTRACDPQHLCPGQPSFDIAPLDMLQPALIRLQTDLTTFWTACDTTRAEQRLPTAPSWANLCADLRLAKEIRAQENWLEERCASFAEDFGDYFVGFDTDWDATLAAIDWTSQLLALYGAREMPPTLRALLAAGGDEAERERLRTLCDETSASLAAMEEELRFVATVLPLRALFFDVERYDDAYMQPHELQARVQLYIENLPCLERWVDCHRQIALCRALGLESFLTTTLSARHISRDLPASFEKRFYQLWLDAILSHSPILGQFQGKIHEEIIARFRKLDEQHELLAQRRLKSRLAQQRTQALDEWRTDADSAAHTHHDSQTRNAFASLVREVNNKQHRSIRKIVRETAPALLTVKPCWMMSPLSISQFVATADPMFDLVIFDEASQVSPEDAICAVLRGKQLIVVGDSKQLPPTRFFTKSLADDADDEDDEDAPETAESQRPESILDECRGAGFRERELLWHYRSKHESLIAFSNEHFYNGKLYTFPSLQAEHRTGVRFEFVADGVYDRGRTQTNRPEAERVVDIMVEHVRQHPERSLGVVALSSSQQSAISDAMEQRLKAQPDLQAFEALLNDTSDKGLFIKNLESVQGDERDVIILSAGYGRDRDGKLTYNFGPINRKGGERRLNVAITRAKYQLILVTSMHASDLRRDFASPGARTLRDYLEFAEFGPQVLVEQERRALAVSGSAPRFESPFEESVYTALTASGFQVDTQVGCSGYRIDLALRDPAQPDIYLLGIECDGATYHSAATARDRDRLRQRHLESMGWHIHRIWSRDWVRNPAGEVQRVLDVVSNMTQVKSAETPQSTAPISLHAVPTPAKFAPDLPAVIPSSDVRSSNEAPLPRAPRLAAPSAVPISLRTCEKCAFYQDGTEQRFYCGKDATMKRRAPDGRTRACDAWKRLA